MLQYTTFQDSHKTEPYQAQVTSVNDYPDLWKQGIIQQEAYARALWRCEHCGMEFTPGTTLAKTARRKDGKPYVLTIHHIDGNKANCTYQNLVALCQRCHLHVQRHWLPGGVLPQTWEQPPNWIALRGLPYKAYAVQLALFGGAA